MQDSDEHQVIAGGGEGSRGADILVLATCIQPMLACSYDCTLSSACLSVYHRLCALGSEVASMRHLLLPVIALFITTQARAAEPNRLAYLDECNPYYPSRT